MVYSHLLMQGAYGCQPVSPCQSCLSPTFSKKLDPMRLLSPVVTECKLMSFVSFFINKTLSFITRRALMLI